MAEVTPQSDVLDRLEAIGNAIITELREIKTVLIAGGGLIEFTKPTGEVIKARRAGTRLAASDGTEPLPKISLPLSALVHEENAANIDRRVWFDWMTGQRIDLLEAWARGDFSGTGGRPDGVVDQLDFIPGQQGRPS